jgi:hypothetical protein
MLYAVTENALFYLIKYRVGTELTCYLLSRYLGMNFPVESPWNHEKPRLESDQPTVRITFTVMLVDGLAI